MRKYDHESLVECSEWESVFDNGGTPERSCDVTDKLAVEGGYIYRIILTCDYNPPIVIMNTVFVPD